MPAKRTRKSSPPVDPVDPLALEIQAVLEDDLHAGARLMQPEYRQHALRHDTLDGYCAAAVAAYFHLGGGRDAGLQPMQHTDSSGDSHWWIDRGGSALVDLVYRRDEVATYDHYGRGVCRGFTNCGYVRVPKRAGEIMAEVKRRRRG